MDVKTIIQELDNMSLEKRLEVYSYLSSRLKSQEYVMNVLERIKGKGKGLWAIDAQEYINEQRANERF